MKYIALIMLLSVSAQANESFEMVFGGLTYHICCDTNTSQKFANKLADGGRLIYTSLGGMKYTNSDGPFYQSAAIFAGQNSIGYNIEGAVFSLGADLDPMTVGLVAGGYIQDRSEMDRRDIITGVGGDVMPITGVEVNFKLYQNKKFYIKENNLFAFFMTNHTISFGWDL